MKLLWCNSHILNKIICYENTASSLCIRTKDKTVNNRHIFHFLMWNIGKHICIRFKRYNLDCKLSFHLVIISKLCNINNWHIIQMLCRSFDCHVRNLCKILSALHLLIKLRNINVHSDIGINRCDRHCIIAFIQLIYMSCCDIHFKAFLIKTCLYFLCNLLFEIFVIHFLPHDFSADPTPKLSF